MRTVLGRSHLPAGALALLVVCAGVAGCHGGATTHASSTSTSSTATTVAPARPAIVWSALRNPLLASPTLAVKDPALVSYAGRWYALFSQVDARGRWRIGITSSPDLRHWSRFTTMPHDPSVAGEASPDVERRPGGGFVVTYQSLPRNGGSAAARLSYRLTSDLRTFTPARPLGRDLHPGPAGRMIDAAVAWTPAGLLLGYKYGTDRQAFEIARSGSGNLDGPWTRLGRPDIRVFGDTIENYQFLHLDGQWRLLATSNALDRPYLFDLAGDPATPAGWLHWSAGRELHVPLEAWNHGTGATGATFEHANCAYLVDATKIGRFFYLVYSDSPNKTTFSGEGPAVLALARSTDLVTWSVPR